MPTAVQLTEPIASPGDGDSLFVTCASFEDRSIGVVKQLSTAYRAEHSIIFRSKAYSNKGKTPQSFQFLSDKLKVVSANEPRLIEFSLEHSIPPLAEFERYCRELSSTSGRQTITVD